MAKDELTPFIQLGPFLGMDNANAQPYMAQGTAVFTENCNTYKFKNGLTAERGRVFLADFAVQFSQINVLTYFQGSFTDRFGSDPMLLMQGPDPGGSNLVTYVYDILNASVHQIIKAVKYTQAIQFGSVIYTNGGQRFFTDAFAFSLQFYTWQYTGFATLMTGSTSLVGGNIPQETRFYVTTQRTVMPDGTISETSPENYPTPLKIVSGAGTTNSNTLSVTGFTTSRFAGTNPDGTTYTTNIYAQTSLQAGYFLVGNAVSNAPFVDTLSDADLATNTPLLFVDGSAFQRDPPPVGITTIPPFGSPNNGVLNQNYAYLAVFSNCLFILTHIDDNIIAGSPNSTQLWYSQAGHGWEFSSDTRALLLQDYVENNLPPITDPLLASSPQYNQLTGDFAKGLAVCGTTLVAWKHREMWLVYGNGSPSAPFNQISAFNVGAQSIRAITPCVGGAFVKTENGVYFFNGQTPTYSEENFRTVSANPPFHHGVEDDIKTVGAFNNLSYILSYPSLGKSYVYNTNVGQWVTELPYAAFSQDAVCYAPSDPSSMSLHNEGGAANVNMMCAVRGGHPTTVDWWFADDANDLGAPTIFTWQGPETDAPGTEFKKEYKMISLYAPNQTGTCTVSLSIDGRLPPYTVTFNLSAARPYYMNLPAGAQGYSAQLSIEVQGIPGGPAPQIWNVKVWGSSQPERKLLIPQ